MYTISDFVYNVPFLTAVLPPATIHSPSTQQLASPPRTSSSTSQSAFQDRIYLRPGFRSGRAVRDRGEEPRLPSVAQEKRGGRAADAPFRKHLRAQEGTERGASREWLPSLTYHLIFSS
ncbi:hypothetical protein HPP92_002170 [Vanilla planifolia]|uniref:Uncharacterized protein n=1 Tax=Vanilla planifolia TaxID=51239 RepID=A0A835SE58_VANPL|nr:hypothetical protein HPP92_002170 [Vanilla planifolia]